MKYLKIRLVSDREETQQIFIFALQVLIVKVTECTSVDQSVEGYIVFIDRAKLSIM